MDWNAYLALKVANLYVVGLYRRVSLLHFSASFSSFYFLEILKAANS
jgi:hypothetical protein